MAIHIVKANESVDTISAAYKVSSDKIIYVNQLIYPYQLAVGQALLIPDDSTNPQKRIKVNGYAYPFISIWVLEQTLPYLTELSVFSYGFTPDGELIPPELNPTVMIEKAKEFDVIPVLTLTPFGRDGHFNNRLISAIVNDMDAQQNLIQELLHTMEEKGYGGLDIDFEYILPEDRDAYTTFVKNVTQSLNQNNYTVSVALAPKSAVTQTGLLYEGKDYGGLGAAANSVLLMTYEWGFTYGPPMAVAPIPQVRKVVEYAVTEIPVKKINLGIPNYGYDWPLPYVKGETKAQTIGNVEAVRLAIEQGVPIQYDEDAQTPYFRYWEDGVQHEVWFEDVRSMQAKFDLIQEFDLRGAGYWQIMQLFRANWLLLSQNFLI
jgi:spore germination protein